MSAAHLEVGGTPSAAQRTALLDALHRLETWGEERGWAGTDPYDALNATRLAGPLKRSVLGRRVLTQLVKRSPIDLRPLLGIAHGHSAAALAQVASGYALGGIPGEAGRARLRRAIGALDQLRCQAYEEPCWGYHFDVQTRVFFYPRTAPNTIATAFTGLALVDAYESTRDERLLALATG